MPTKKKKFNARFPPARIKKIMQTDDDVGKVAAPVPVIISKALEMFMQSLVEKACNYTQARNAKTLSTSHLKRCIISEQQFDFLKDLVENIPDLPANEEDGDGEPKPKRKKAQPTANKDKEKTRKREKKKEKIKPTISDDSDEEADSEEEESLSSGSHSNPGNSSTSTSTASVPPPTITITKPDNEQDEVFEAAALPMPPSFSHLTMLNTCTSIEEEDDDYDS